MMMQRFLFCNLILIDFTHTHQGYFECMKQFWNNVIFPSAEEASIKILINGSHEYIEI